MRDGRQSLDVLDLVDAELKMVLAGGLKRALTEPAPIVFNGRAHPGDGDRLLQGDHPARSPSAPAARRHLLVSFESREPEPSGRSTRRRSEIDVDQVSREQLAALEAELRHTKENLQAAIEELETSNEELQATNEELQASNEELQSTNEELQSVNEELYTVNAEYQRKIAELTELTNDMDNLLASTEVGTIFLDRQLRIRKFTPQIAETLQPAAAGRRPPDRDLRAQDATTRSWSSDLQRVLATGQPVERELRDRRRASRSSCASCPTAPRARIDGVVLTLIDVSGLKAAEDALFHERYLLNSLLAQRARRDLLQGRARPLHPRQPAMAARLGLDDPREAIGKTAFELPDHEAAHGAAPARTRPCCARASRSTTSSSSDTAADGDAKLGPGDAAAAASIATRRSSA